MQDRERWHKGLVREWGFPVWLCNVNLYTMHEVLEKTSMSSKEDKHSQKIGANKQAESWIRK